MELMNRVCRLRDRPDERSETVTDSEKLWLARSREGDVESFEKLIERYQKTAYNVALRMMRNEEDAKDATQEALIKAFRSIRSFRGESGFSTWLYRILVNTCKDELRKRRGNLVSLEQGRQTEAGFEAIELADETFAPEVVLESRTIRQTINEAIRTLPEQNRAAVVLRDVQGYSYEDIGAILGCPVGTVKSRINRGRQLLKEALSLKPVSEGGSL